MQFDKKHNAIAIAIAALLFGGVATAAYLNNDGSDPRGGLTATDEADAPSLAYADVVATQPITERVPRYGEVIASAPVRETTTSSSTRQVCEDVAVQERLPERDGNVGGAVAGAVIGGLIGNQIGDGDGRKLATVAGAVGGGFAGREIDRRHVGGQVVTRTQRQCSSVPQTSSRTETVGWDVTYRDDDGRVSTLRTDRKPGSRIDLGSRDEVIGYDVTYRYMGREQTLRMDHDPGKRLPVIDGQVAVALVPATTAGAGVARQ